MEIIEREMVDERSKFKMNVELAILRELEYRRKVFLSQSKADDDLDPVPLQVQSSSTGVCPSENPHSSPMLSGMKRQTPSSSAECPSPQLLQSFHSNPMHANQTENIFCRICHVPCSGAYSYKQHINGRKHQAKLQELKCDRIGVCPDGKVAKKKRWCQLCKVWCMDEISFESHLNGKRHKGEIQKAKCGMNSSGGTAKQQKWCKLCDIWCPNEDAFRMHINGKIHVLRFHDNQEKRRVEIMGNCSRKS